jgi:intein-encoded DNA endonuclease-like protein
MLQILILFVVTESSFSDLRDKTNKDELEDMLEVLKKRFIKEFPNGKGITWFHSRLEVVPLTHARSAMLSFNQGRESYPKIR